MRMESLVLFLEHNAIPFAGWADGLLEQLLTEVNARKTDIRTVNGRVIRTFSTVAVNVYFSSGSSVFKLVEASTFSSCRELSTSLVEKMLPDEEPRDAVRRALRELQVLAPVEVITSSPVTLALYQSPTYLGTFTAKKLYPCEVLLDQKHFTLAVARHFGLVLVDD